MLVVVIAALLLLLVLFGAFRFAMGLRYAKQLREQALLEELERGRRLVAEVPTPAGEIELFLEDESGFYWGGAELGKRDLSGARLLINGAVMGECCRDGAELPPAAEPEEYDGSERWEVVAYLATSAPRLIPCGSLREGVSRDAARSVFESMRAACRS